YVTNLCCQVWCVLFHESTRVSFLSFETLLLLQLLTLSITTLLSLTKSGIKREMSVNNLSSQIWRVIENKARRSERIFPGSTRFRNTGFAQYAATLPSPTLAPAIVIKDKRCCHCSCSCGHVTA